MSEALKRELYETADAMHSVYGYSLNRAPDDYSIPDLLQYIKFRNVEWADFLELTRREFVWLEHLWRIDLWQMFRRHGVEFFCHGF